MDRSPSAISEMVERLTLADKSLAVQAATPQGVDDEPRRGLRLLA
jgi:hypothetical protein